MLACVRFLFATGGTLPPTEKNKILNLGRFSALIGRSRSADPDQIDRLDGRICVEGRLVVKTSLKYFPKIASNQYKDLPRLDGDKEKLIASKFQWDISDVLVGIVDLCLGTDLIFPFSENGPANYNFSLFSKLPTNYPKNPKIFKKTIYFFRKYGETLYFRSFF